MCEKLLLGYLLSGSSNKDFAFEWFDALDGATAFPHIMSGGGEEKMRAGDPG